MKSLQNIVGILSILCVIGPADAALRTTTATNQGRSATGGSRVGIVTASQAAARRLPTISNGSSSVSTGSSSTSDTAKTTTETEADCISDYTDCIKGSEVCGENFEECVNTDLFHGKMPQCNSVLLRCPSSAVYKLFGTTSVTELSQQSGSTFSYPTGASLMQQAIQAGAINNRLDTGNCVKKYMSCLSKEGACGADFEYCTSVDAFKKQRIYCESTLARCQDEGKIQLFGSTDTSKMTDGSRVKIAITDGADLAAANAVSTCYKVVDRCFIDACSVNPYRCMVGITYDILGNSEGNPNTSSNPNIDMPKFAQDAKQMLEDQRVLRDGTNGSGGTTDANPSDTTTEKDIAGYIKNVCLDTIGSNAYCHLTFGDRNTMPSKKELIENAEDIFNAAYNDRMKKNSGMQTRIFGLRDTFDKKAKDACVETISKCARRVCGSGVGSKCYSCAKTSDGSVHVNGANTYPGIKSGCEAIVNTDPNCIYAAAVVNTTTGYVYSYEYSRADAFTTLFPEFSNNGNADPINVVSKLNASLAENYNDAVMDEMASSCKKTTRSCIESMCGSDFSNCYRNRTDIMADTYAIADETKFNASMNKVNGILDFTIIRGLCNTVVTEAKSCNEYLKVLQVKGGSCNTTHQGSPAEKDTSGRELESWGADIGSAWSSTARGYSRTSVEIEGVETGMCYTNSDSNKCKTPKDNKTTMECGYVDDQGCIYDDPETETVEAHNLNLATNTLFQEVLKQVEQTAQAQYNVKLTKEQNKCVNLNNGGVVGRNSMTYGDTYKWVKLKSKSAPKNYEIKGLKSTDFDTSNDLYGSFCRIQVTLRSDEPAIQDYLSEHPDAAKAYFAAGDAFTCGSWLNTTDLNAIATTAASKEVCQSLYTKNNAKKNKWTTDEIAQKCADGKLSKDQNLKAWLLSGAVGATTFAGASELIQAGVAGKLGGKKNTAGFKKGSCTAQLDSLINTNASTATQVGESGYCTVSNYVLENTQVSVVKYEKASSGAPCNKAQIEEYNKTLNGYKTTYCDNLTGGGSGKELDPWKHGVVTAASGVGGYLLTSGAAVGIMKSQNREKFSEAQKQWMDEIGSHIQCYVGPDEAGSYGDIVQVTLD